MAVAVAAQIRSKCRIGGSGGALGAGAGSGSSCRPDRMYHDPRGHFCIVLKQLVCC